MTEHVRLEVADDGVATVTLDRPPVNAVTQAMYREIRAVLEEVGRDERVKVAILTGAGRHFCGGNDLNEFMTLSPENSPERMREVREAFWSIHGCPVPVIAAVQGVAVGTGLALVASCDMAIAATGAKLGVPEIGVGVMGGGKHLSRLLPQPLVRKMFFTGEPMAVEELAHYGAVVGVVPPEDLLAEATALARSVSRHSAIAIRYAKRALNEIEPMDLREGYEHEQGYTGELSGFEDAKEAIRAFFERRPPQYTGRV
jgi:enoyl-CoA hydratase